MATVLHIGIASLLALATLLSVCSPARGQELASVSPTEGSGAIAVPPAELTNARLDSLLALLEGQDPARLEDLEARYARNGDPEKRLLETRFGIIEHRYRVDADPGGIYRRWRAAGLREEKLTRALEELVAGRYSAYYFFDGVIRPNTFAPKAYLARRESAVHEKVHLVQPAIYRVLGLSCQWHNPRDACVRSLEPVAVYLTEFAVLKRASPTRSDQSVNRAIERHLALEASRCGYAEPVPRCPRLDRAREYVLEPLELARAVARHGLEEGIRRFVEGFSSKPSLALSP